MSCKREPPRCNDRGGSWQPYGGVRHRGVFPAPAVASGRERSNSSGVLELEVAATGSPTAKCRSKQSRSGCDRCQRRSPRQRRQPERRQSIPSWCYYHAWPARIRRRATAVRSGPGSRTWANLHLCWLSPQLGVSVTCSKEPREKPPCRKGMTLLRLNWNGLPNLKQAPRS